jgi:hypothetical protein
MKPAVSTRRNFLKQATGFGLSAAALGSVVSASAIGKSGERACNGSTFADSKLWFLNITLSHPKLEPPVVQVALFHKDPVPGFTTRLKRIGQVCGEQLQAADSGRQKRIRLAQMMASWNYGFRDVRGDQVHLLVSGTRFQLCSNEPAGKRWVVTKCVEAEGEIVSWCLPVELQAGNIIEVSLTDENAFDLSASYETETG